MTDTKRKIVINRTRGNALIKQKQLNYGTNNGTEKKQHRENHNKNNRKKLQINYMRN